MDLPTSELGNQIKSDQISLICFVYIFVSHSPLRIMHSTCYIYDNH